MSEIPDDLRCGKDHLWTCPNPGTGLVGIGVTDFAQRSLGDIVGVSRPSPGGTVRGDQACGDIESVKTASDLIAPITGTVRSRNEALAQAPELVSTDPYGQRWMVEIKTDTATLGQQLASLLNAAGYGNLVGE
jgi:glycine cleavage system H protein